MSADTYAETKATVKRLAAEAFDRHELHGAPHEWRCKRPGTGMYAFTVLVRPGVVAVWGDLGEWILRHADADSLGWLRGAINSPEYVIGKIKAGEREEFYPADALAYLKERDEDAYPAKTLEAVREDLSEWDGYFDKTLWFKAWSDAGVSASDAPDCEYPTAGALWLIEALRCFLRLLDGAK